MENLFYERPVTQKFDLKGSVRNRHVNIDDQDSEIVLLDENLLKSRCSYTGLVSGLEKSNLLYLKKFLF